MKTSHVLPILLLVLAATGCRADEEAIRTNGEVVDFDRAEEIEAAPRTPMEITEEGDTIYPPGGAATDAPEDTIRAGDVEMQQPDRSEADTARDAS